MTKYLNFFESESGFTEAVEAGQLFFPNVSYTEEDDTVHWNLAQPADPVETPMLRMYFTTSSPGEGVKLRNGSGFGVTAMEIDGTPVNFVSGGTYAIAEPGNHTAVYQFESPEIPERLFCVPDEPFSAFTSAEIISPVTTIGERAFAVCRSLQSVTLPDNLTSIANEAFLSCYSLHDINIPSGVTTIGERAFALCRSLQSVTLPDNLTTIGNEVFGRCDSLQSVTLPGNLTAIGKIAFIGCYSLYDINIPSGVTTIGEHAFLNCSGLTAIYLNSETPPTLGANALDNTNDCPIYVPAASVETYQQAWPAYASRITLQYNITASVNDDTLGEINLEQETASEGDHVEFDVMVFDSEQNQVSSVTVTDGNGDEVQCTNDFDNHYSFTMPDSDVTISVTIGEKPKHTVTVNSTDDLVNPDDIHFNSDDGEPSFREGNMADFSFNLPEGLQLVSVQASDCDGNSIEVELEDGGDGFHFCYFTMPHCDVSVFITVTLEEKPEGQYKISTALNDDSLGQVNLEQETANEGDHVEFDVMVFDSEQNQVSSVTVTDGNGDEVECNEDWDNHYSFDMPASDVTIEATVEEKPKYHISVDLNDEELGKVNLEKETASEGDQVNFNVRIFDSGQNQVSSVTVTDGNGDEVEYTVKDYGGGVLHLYTFKMPASNVTISVTIEKKQ